MDEVKAGGAPESPQGWEALALLAVSTAVIRTLPAKARRRVRKRLATVARDWEREGDGGLAEPMMRAAAQRFIRPLLTHLDSDETGRG